MFGLMLLLLITLSRAENSHTHKKIFTVQKKIISKSCALDNSEKCSTSIFTLELIPLQNQRSQIYRSELSLGFPSKLGKSHHYVPLKMNDIHLFSAQF